MRRRVARLTIVLAGLVLGQCILYGPSLAGRKILLPLDILALPGKYLPVPPGSPEVEAHNVVLQDLIALEEPARRFAATELRAGRLPMWRPDYYAGAPFVWPKFSPFLLLECCVESPVVLAWVQLLAAVVSGLGAYFFFRRVLEVGFWPATVTAWCYPLTAFLVFWQGLPTAVSVYWLPWLLLAVNATARGANPFAPVWLGVVTALALLSGHLDVAAQVLLASGLFGLWCLFDSLGAPRMWKPVAKAAAILAVAWGVGLLLAAPYILPVKEYSQTGARMSRRFAGLEERPPVGLSALPQTVLPNMYGSSETGSLRLTKLNELESSAAAYSGIFATLLVAPLAWFSRRHRRINFFWALLAFLSLGWCLNVPGLVQLLRLPGANMLSHNRFVFAASFAILALTTVGLEVLSKGPVPWRRWLWIPPAVLAGLCAWCAYRAAFLPEPVDTELGIGILQGGSYAWIHDLQGVERVRSWFTWHYVQSALLCVIGLGGWWLIWSGRIWRLRLMPVIAALMIADLLWFGYGRNPQCDPSLYFPQLPVLTEVARSAPGRIIGGNCLPANFATMCGLRDIRGYDGVDPARLMDLMMLGAASNTPSYRYAQVQMLLPKLDFTPTGGVRLSPVFDLLGVRYVIFQGSPLPGSHPRFDGPDYWVMENSNALARAFVPRRVELAAEPKERLAKLASADFDPRAVAYVEEPVDLPAQCAGKAEIIRDLPTDVTLAIQMNTPGLLVLADLWDQGWRAKLNGKPVPILRADHALRGVVVPAGSSTLEFRYAPASFVLGLRLALFAAISLSVWLLLALFWHRHRPTQTEFHSGE